MKVREKDAIDSKISVSVRIKPLRDDEQMDKLIHWKITRKDDSYMLTKPA